MNEMLKFKGVRTTRTSVMAAMDATASHRSCSFSKDFSSAKVLT